MLNRIINFFRKNNVQEWQVIVPGRNFFSSMTLDWNKTNVGDSIIVGNVKLIRIK